MPLYYRMHIHAIFHNIMTHASHSAYGRWRGVLMEAVDRLGEFYLPIGFGAREEARFDAVWTQVNRWLWGLRYSIPQWNEVKAARRAECRKDEIERRQWLRYAHRMLRCGQASVVEPNSVVATALSRLPDVLCDLIWRMTG